MMDVDTAVVHRDSRNQSLATDLVPGAVPTGQGEEEEEEDTPVKRLDAAFEVLTKANPLNDAPALQVACRIRPLAPGKESCMEIKEERKVGPVSLFDPPTDHCSFHPPTHPPIHTQVHTTTPPTSVNFKILGQQVKEYTFHRVFGPDSTQEVGT